MRYRVLAGLFLVVLCGCSGAKAAGRVAVDPLDAEWDTLADQELASLGCPKQGDVVCEHLAAFKAETLPRVLLAEQFGLAPQLCTACGKNLVRRGGSLVLGGAPLRMFEVMPDDGAQALRQRALSDALEAKREPPADEGMQGLIKLLRDEVRKTQISPTYLRSKNRTARTEILNLETSNAAVRASGDRLVVLGMAWETPEDSDDARPVVFIAAMGISR